MQGEQYANLFRDVDFSGGHSSPILLRPLLHALSGGEMLLCGQNFILQGNGRECEPTNQTTFFFFLWSCPA
jgi:hypothetical protein